MVDMQIEDVLKDSNKSRVANRLKGNNGRWCPPSPSDSRHAAVLVSLLMLDCEPAVLLTVRSNQLLRHRGQVSFPGGLADLTDVSATATALREAEEELGIPSSQIDVWGELPQLPDRLRSTIITPVIGNLGHLDLRSIRINKAEVSQVFTLSLRQLLVPSNRRYTHFRPDHIRFPVFLGGPRRVWGITAFILDLTLHYILPKHFQYISQAKKL